MSSVGERLREARKRSGYETADAAAQALGVSPSTYRAHENEQNGLKPRSAAKYAKKFSVSEVWLLFGHGDEGTGRSMATNKDQGMIEVGNEQTNDGIAHTGPVDWDAFAKAEAKTASWEKLNGTLDVDDATRMTWEFYKRLTPGEPDT